MRTIRPPVRAKFALGRLLITSNATTVLSHAEVLEALQRHRAGDWGELCAEDRAENETSLRQGLRLLSVYRTPSGDKFWVITEADRSATTVLMPEDY